MFLLTNEFAPIIQFLPILIPSLIIEPAPMKDEYPNLKIAYSPEFLVERRHLEDFGAQDILVCGTHHGDLAETVFEHHRTAGVLRNDQCFHVTPTQAELVKYTKNSFYRYIITTINN